MKKADPNRWRRLLGYIIESEGVRDYSIPENPILEASSDPLGARIIAYAEDVVYVIANKKYIIEFDLYYRCEDATDRVAIPYLEKIDPAPDSRDSTLINTFLGRCLQKLAEEIGNFVNDFMCS